MAKILIVPLSRSSPPHLQGHQGPKEKYPAGGAEHALCLGDLAAILIGGLVDEVEDIGRDLEPVVDLLGHRRVDIPSTPGEGNEASSPSTQAQFVHHIEWLVKSKSCTGVS
jgi:hypothetical protein